MLDCCYYFVLLLNATGLFSFIAPQIGVSIGNISTALLVFNIMYLAANAGRLRQLLRKKWVILWIVVLMIWPLITLIYAPSIEYRQIGLQLYYCTLFLGAIVFTTVNNISKLHSLILLSLALTILGMILSMIAPQYFESVGILAGYNIGREGRPFGFLMEPNRLAVTMAILFIGWYFLWKCKNSIMRIPVLISLIIAMLLTGSRAGIIVVAMIIISSIIPSFRAMTFNIKTASRAIALIVCIVAAIIGIRYWLTQYQFEDRSKQELNMRIEALSKFRLTNESSISDDGSVQTRLSAQSAYWDLISEKPIIGFGIGSDAYYQEKGTILMSAHSDALASAMQFGCLYPIAIIALLIQIYYGKRRYHIEKMFQSHSISQCIIIVIALYAFTGDILDNRAIYVILGIFASMSYCPEKWQFQVRHFRFKRALCMQKYRLILQGKE